MAATAAAEAGGLCQGIRRQCAGAIEGERVEGQAVRAKQTWMQSDSQSRLPYACVLEEGSTIT